MERSAHFPVTAPLTRRALLLTRRALLMIGAAALGGAMLAPRRLRAQTPRVTNETTGAQPATLAEALAAARPGDVLRLEGVHNGNHVIDVPLTLRGEIGAGIDAGGSGTPLVVLADDVIVTGLTLTGSGRRAAFNIIWGPAGLRVEGNRARLEALTITGNDMGLLLLGAADAVVTGCRFENNAADGINVMGGRDHRIVRNAIHRNGVGVTLGPRYGTASVMPIPEAGDGAALQQAIEMLEAAEGPRNITVENNEVHGNGWIGIHVFTNASDCVVAGNQVRLTGRDRLPDRASASAYLAHMSARLGGVEIGDEIYWNEGSGIWLSCDTFDHRVTGNHSHDNLGVGIGANMTYRTLFGENLVERNASGIWLDDADDNEVRSNRVADNRDFGIAIDTWLHRLAPAPNGSGGNLLVLNTMTGNRTNAYDSSDRLPVRAEVEARIDAMPLPPALRALLRSDPAFRDRMVAGQLASHQPGTNRWDDGALGNHYDDFDDPAEGFRDADGDGVGEVAHPIPGGGMVDHFPLTAAKSEALRQGG